MVAIQIVCAKCGRRTKEVIFDGSAPRNQIEELRDTRGWTHQRPRNFESMQDYCPGCSGELASRKSVRNTTSRKGGV